MSDREEKLVEQSATRQEHEDLAPHVGCECRLCAALHDGAEQRAHLEALAGALRELDISDDAVLDAPGLDPWDIITVRRPLADWRAVRAALARLPAQALAERRALEAVACCAPLKRNTTICDELGFEGEWVAVPGEDFDALRDALAVLDAARREGGA